MANTKTTEPTRIYQGESLSWTKSLADYPSSDGWTLKYYFRGKDAKLDIIASADGSGGYQVAASINDTEQFVPGLYDWQAFATKAGESHFIASGRLEVEASLKNIGTHDGRSVVKQTLDAIDAMIKGSASVDQLSYTIGNRRLDRIPKPDLIKFRQHYATLYDQERRVERAKKGLPFFESVNIRFRGPQ